MPLRMKTHLIERVEGIRDHHVGPDRILGHEAVDNLGQTSDGESAFCHGLRRNFARDLEVGRRGGTGVQGACGNARAD